MEPIPHWLSIAEMLTFFILIVSFIALMVTITHNRLTSWKSFETRTRDLETSFGQYQKDTLSFRETLISQTATFRETMLEQSRTHLEMMQNIFSQYLTTCESCRKEVRAHHESDVRHVTSDLRSQIQMLIDGQAEIKTFLLENASRWGTKS